MHTDTTIPVRRTAYSYIRFSSQKQEQGDSLRRQTKAAQEFCERFDLILNPATYQDLGVSALRGKNAHEGNLRSFLRACEDGKIERGSVLIVENLDRISRQQIVEATTLFLEIIEYVDLGVAQAPARIYSKQELNENRFALFEVQLAFVRANEESEVKSQRLRKVWAEKKRKAATEIVTSRCPSWMTLSADRKEFILIPERVALLREIFDMCINQGYGVYTITQMLNQRGEEAWGRSKIWQNSYIKLLLTGEAALGTYVQSESNHVTGKRQTNGVRIENYYPKVIDETTYRRAQAALASRRGGGGKRGYSVESDYVANLFTGLLTDGYTGSAIHYMNKSRWHYLSPAYCKNGKVGYYMAWEYDDFEALFLQLALHEEYAELVRRTDSDETDRIDDLRAEIQLLKTKIDNVSAAIAEIGLSDGLKRKLVELESRLPAHQRELNTLMLEQKFMDEDFVTLIRDGDFAERLHRDAALRNRFRAVVESTYSKIEVFFEGDLQPYVDNLEKIHERARGGDTAFRDLVKFMKKLRCVRVHYHNGSSMKLIDQHRAASAEPLLEKLLKNRKTRRYVQGIGDLWDMIA